MLPGVFLASSTVYSYYRKWQKRGIWEQMNHTLRDQVRQKMGKSTQPSAIAKDLLYQWSLMRRWWSWLYCSVSATSKRSCFFVPMFLI